MLKVLVKKELQLILRERFLRSGKSRKSGKTRQSGKGMLLIWGFLVLYLMAFFTYFAWSLGRQLLSLPNIGWVYYLMLGGAAILFGTLGSVFNTYSSLYLSKDNDLLFSLPIPVRDVILSRLLSVFLMGLFYSGALSLPAWVVGLIQCGFSLSRLLGGLVWVLLIALIVLGLSCLLGWVVARISLRLKNRSFLIALVSLAFLVLYYVGYFRIYNHLPEILAELMRYGEEVRSSLNPLYLFGRVGEGDWLGAFLWAAALALALGLIWLLLKKSFLATATASPAAKQAVYREKPVRQARPTAALLRKEWGRFSGSANYMLNCGLGLLMMPAAALYLLIRGKDILIPLEQLMGQDVLPVLAAAVLALLSSMADITAPSVSLESKTLWQLQSLPVSPWQVLQAKLELHLLLAAGPALLSTVCVAAAVPGTLAQKLLLAALGLLFVLFTALLGLMLDLKRPKLDWTNETVAVKQSLSVLITIFSTMGLSMAMGGLYFLLGRDLGATVWLGIWTLLLAAADALIFLWLRRRGAARFARLS